MAYFKVDIPNDLLNGILQCNSEEVCKEILERAAEPLEESIKKELANHKDTGDLQSSIKAGKPYLNKDGFWQITISPKGYSGHHFYGGKNHNRKYKLSNAAKAIFMEYGTSHQAATPFLNRATNNAQHDTLSTMQETFERLTKQED